MEFLQIWQILLRRKRILLSVFFCFFFLILILLLIIPKTYEGSTKVLVNKSIALPNLYQSLDFKISSDRSETYEWYTEINLALNKVTLQELIKDLSLKDRYGDVLETDDFVKWSIINKFSPQPYVSVEQYESGEMLEIKATARDPELAAKISNRLAELYINSEIKRINAEFEKMEAFVRQKLDENRDAYYLIFDELVNYQKKEGMANISYQASKVIDKVYALKDSYDSNEKELLEFKKNIPTYQKQIAAREKFRKDSRSFALNDQLKTIKAKINDLMIDLAAKSVMIREKHPDYIQIEKEIEKARDLLKKESDLILTNEGYSIDPIYDDLAKQLVAAIISQEISLLRRTIYKKYLDVYYQEMMKLPQQYAGSAKFDDKLSVNKAVYQSLQKFLLEIKIAKSVNQSDIRIYEPATPPKKVKFPKPPLILAMALVFGTFWSLAVTFFIDYIDVNIKKFNDLKQIKSAKLLGNLPPYKDLENNKTVSRSNLSHHESASYRAIRNNVQMSEQPGYKNKVLLITSTCAGEGKTNFAANYAAMLSDEGINTILIDLHINYPSVHNYFGLENTNGLSELISGAVTMNDPIGKVVGDHLTVLPAGRFDKKWFNKEEMTRIQDILSNLKNKYNMVILDAPSIYPSRDVFSLIKYVDDIIYIIAPGRTTLEEIQENVNQLRQIGLKWIGLVANRFSDERNYQFISPLKWLKNFMVNSNLHKDKGIDAN